MGLKFFDCVFEMKILLLFELFMLFYHTNAKSCAIPKHMQSSYTSLGGTQYEGDEVLFTDIDKDYIEVRDLKDTFVFKAYCHEFIVVSKSVSAVDFFDVKIVLHNRVLEEYICWQVFARTKNVLQRHESSWTSQNAFRSGESIIKTLCDDYHVRSESVLYTMFRTVVLNENCRNTFEGVYNFQYAIQEDRNQVDSFCASPHSRIVACQFPGSSYLGKDNIYFIMEFGKCAEVSNSIAKSYNFKCLGSWRDEKNNLWYALDDISSVNDPRKRFRCMRTREDQEFTENKLTYTMSHYSECNTLLTDYYGDMKFTIQPAVLSDKLTTPFCNLPKNFTGTWLTTGEFASENVVINTTHIYFKIKVDQHKYIERYFTCQMNLGSRYLMTAVTVGRCEVDYVCFDFVPRHHNLIRWRLSKPYRVTDSEQVTDQYLDEKFRQTCSWVSFTMDRKQTDWTYYVLILDPPAPVDCPIAGRYSFTQKTNSESEKYHTRVEGITVRPRHSIDCYDYTSTLESCRDNTNTIAIDVEYCSTVDHTGRPIGEYDIADNELFCVGYWMEDMKSYMITYDEEDAVSAYRCWVYERLDWRKIRMSRSTRATCFKQQNSTSYKTEDGASLFMELTENERIFDDCPMRFSDGKDPSFNELQVHMFNSSGRIHYTCYFNLLLYILLLISLETLLSFL